MSQQEFKMNYRCGYEFELLAPPGSSRRKIAEELASQLHANTSQIFHQQSEPSPMLDGLTYQNLTRGYRLETEGQWLLDVIDDITIKAGLNSEAPAIEGEFKLLANDRSIIELMKLYCKPTEAYETMLEPMAKLFGTENQKDNDCYFVRDLRNNNVCFAFELKGERERPCEIVTSPISEGHFEKVSQILEVLKKENCLIPKEAALHIHFDGLRFQNSAKFLKLVRYFYCYGDILKHLVPPNPNCTRLGEYSNEVVSYCFDRANETKEWWQIKFELDKLKITKYCDFNVRNILRGMHSKLTVEIRTIQMTFDVNAIMAATDLFGRFLHLAETGVEQELCRKIPVTPESIEEFLGLLGFS